MASENVDLVRSLYGINWVAIGERERALAAARELLADDVQARMSPEVADRTLNGVDEFAVFVQGLEEDFSAFQYDADEVTEGTPGEVLVRGHIHARGRRSNMPLTAPFGHVWKLRDGRAVSVDARIDVDDS